MMPSDVLILLPRQAQWLLFGSAEDDLAHINDDSSLRERTRETRIRKEFAKHGVEVEFVP